MSQNVIEAIEQRRSVRKFKPDPIPESFIQRILNCGLSAPSAGNLQPWQLWVVKLPHLKAALAEAACGQRFVEKAPVVIVVVAEPERSAAKYGSRGANIYCLQDTAALIQNMLLTATAFGIGSCWVGAFDEKTVGKVLGLSEGLRPVALLPMGYPAEVLYHPPRSKKPLTETVITLE